MEQCELTITGREGLAKNSSWDVGHTISDQCFYPIAVYKCISFLTNLQFICVSRGYLRGKKLQP